MLFTDMIAHQRALDYQGRSINKCPSQNSAMRKRKAGGVPLSWGCVCIVRTAIPTLITSSVSFIFNLQWNSTTTVLGTVLAYPHYLSLKLRFTSHQLPYVLSRHRYASRGDRRCYAYGSRTSCRKRTWELTGYYRTKKEESLHEFIKFVRIYGTIGYWSWLKISSKLIARGGRFHCCGGHATNATPNISLRCVNSVNLISLLWWRGGSTLALDDTQVIPDGRFIR